MIRKGFIMRVYKEYYEEYKKRHDEIWPEMVKELKAHGAHNYSIFLDERTGHLFGYLEIEDEELWKKMAETEINQKWWAYMEPLMETNPDNSPVTVELKQVFYME